MHYQHTIFHGVSNRTNSMLWVFLHFSISLMKNKEVYNGFIIKLWRRTIMFKFILLSHGKGKNKHLFELEAVDQLKFIGNATYLTFGHIGRRPVYPKQSTASLIMHDLSHSLASHGFYVLFSSSHFPGLCLLHSSLRHWGLWPLRPSLVPDGGCFSTGSLQQQAGGGPQHLKFWNLKIELNLNNFILFRLNFLAN